MAWAKRLVFVALSLLFLFSFSYNIDRAEAAHGYNDSFLRPVASQILFDSFEQPFFQTFDFVNLAGDFELYLYVDTYYFEEQEFSLSFVAQQLAGYALVKISYVFVGGYLQGIIFEADQQAQFFALSQSLYLFDINGFKTAFVLTDEGLMLYALCSNKSNFFSVIANQSFEFGGLDICPDSIGLCFEGLSGEMRWFEARGLCANYEDLAGSTDYIQAQPKNPVYRILETDFFYTQNGGVANAGYNEQTDEAYIQKGAQNMRLFHSGQRMAAYVLDIPFYLKDIGDDAAISFFPYYYNSKNFVQVKLDFGEDITIQLFQCLNGKIELSAQQAVPNRPLNPYGYNVFQASISVDRICVYLDYELVLQSSPIIEPQSQHFMAAEAADCSLYFAYPLFMDAVPTFSGNPSFDYSQKADVEINVFLQLRELMYVELEGKPLDQDQYHYDDQANSLCIYAEAFEGWDYGQTPLLIVASEAANLYINLKIVDPVWEVLEAFVKTDYFIGQEFDQSGYLRVIRHSQKISDLYLSDAQISGFDSSIESQQNPVTIDFGEFEFKVEVNIRQAQIVGFEPPQKQSMRVNSTFEPPAVDFYFEDGTTKSFELDWQTQSIDFAKSGNYQAYASFEGFEVVLPLEIYALPIAVDTDLPPITAYLGQTPILPSYVLVLMEDGTMQKYSVEWDLSELDAAQAGEYYAYCEVLGVLIRLNISIIEKNQRAQELAIFADIVVVFALGTVCAARFLHKTKRKILQKRQ